MRVQSFLTFGDPMDCSLPSSSVPGISQARKLEWNVISYSRGSFQPRDQTCISCLLHWLSDSLSLNHLGSPQLLPTTAVFVYILRLKTESESNSVASDPLWPHCLYSPWNSPSQNTVMSSLPFSRGSSQSRDQTQVSHIAGGFFTSWATREAQKYSYG